MNSDNLTLKTKKETERIIPAASFADYLSYGEIVELKVLELIRVKYPLAYKIDGYFKGYDIYIPELHKGIEVKSDQKSRETNNLVIEIEFNSRPSALSTTKASYWTFYNGLTFLWTTPQRIRECIRRYNYKPATFTATIDKSPKVAYLVKVEHLNTFAL